MKAEINERVELVQILLYLADEQEKTVQYLKNKVYLRTILNDDSHMLNAWARETVRFSRKSGFDDFFRTQKEHYSEILEYVSSCDFDTYLAPHW